MIKTIYSSQLTVCLADTNSTIPCPQCHRLFYRKDLLHRHLTLKHGEPPRAGRANDTSNATVTGRPLHNIPADPPSTSVQRGQMPQTADATTNFEHSQYVPGSPSAGPGPNGSTLALSPDLFSFAAPSLELAQDWNWLNHGAIPSLSPSTHAMGGQVDQIGIVEVVRVRWSWGKYFTMLLVIKSLTFRSKNASTKTG